MAMQHHIQMYVIQRRIRDKFGKARITELRKILADLPGYKNGPYGEIRRWVFEEIEKSKVRRSLIFRDMFAVRREGDYQVVIVGPPNAGKSSLLNAISKKQVKIADYAFTTLYPVPSSISFDGVVIQIVEVPGLIKGASEDKGFGRRLLGVVKQADGIVFLFDASTGFLELEVVMEEVRKAGIEKPYIVVGNKADVVNETQKKEALKQFGKVVFVSAKENAGISALREALWNMSGLMRVFTCGDIKPVALLKGSTVLDLAYKIHKDLAERAKSAKINGPSIKFPNQEVGMGHVLKDGDRVKLIDK